MAKLSLGLDIGSHQVKLVALSQKGRKLRLDHVGMMPLPAETIVDEELLNSAALVSTLRELLAKTQVRRRETAIALGGRATIIRHIRLPAMSEAELEESLAWEAKQYIPFDLDEVYLDFHMGNIDPETEQMDVILVAAKRTVVDDYCAAVRLAGLRPVVVDTLPFASANTYCHAYPEHFDEVAAVVDLGAHLCTIAVVHRGEVLYSRALEQGSAKLTDALQRQLALPYAQAEAFKTGDVGDGLVPADVQRVLEEASGEIVTELRSLINHHADQGGVALERLFLSGGAANSDALCMSIAREVGLDAARIDPFRSIASMHRGVDKAALASIGCQGSIAFGLAQRSTLDRLQASKDRK
ncbi:MAG: type IV pilus assembly protein PilM [Myxococcota bacterium]|jgi:type IV pilus assembly protein PilM|nr:type IV pilus assembly protein PilM [Myxococcota bacterium]